MYSLAPGWSLCGACQLSAATPYPMVLEACVGDSRRLYTDAATLKATYLQAGVHLHEVVVSGVCVHNELHCASVHIADSLCCSHSGRANADPEVFADGWGWRLFYDLQCSIERVSHESACRHSVSCRP